MAGSSTRDWDASTYQRVALPHEEWARAVLDRLGLEGGETVLDAGCGSGRTTAIVIERLPSGRVIAVDGSPSMVEKVQEVLRPQDTALVSDLTKLELDEQVDAVFSTAVFHWILDHDALFARMRAALRDGGRFAAQCGGEGNIDAFRRAGEEVAAREPYARHLGEFRAALELRRAGGDRRAPARGGLHRRPLLARALAGATRPSPHVFAKTVCLGALRRARCRTSCATSSSPTSSPPSEDPLRLDYVRLNIEATAA